VTNSWRAARWNLRSTLYRFMSCNFRGYRIQYNLLGQIAASRCERSPTFQGETPSSSSRCFDGTLNMATESLLEMVENSHTLTQLSALEDCIELYRLSNKGGWICWACSTLDRDEECVKKFYRETSREELLERTVCRRQDVILEFVVKMKIGTHRPPLPPSKYSWYSFMLGAE